MSKYALIRDGYVSQTFDSLPTLHADFMAKIEQVSDNVQDGMVRQDDGSFAFNAPSVSEIKAGLKAHRQSVETGGFTVGGIAMESDEKTERRVIGVYARAKADSQFTINDWRLADGSFVNLSNAQLVAIGEGFTAHVNKCFTTEKAVVALIDDGTITTPDAAVAKFNEVWNV